MSKIFLTGASSGIGLATAKALCARGHEVWGTSRDPERILKLAGLQAVRLDLEERGSVTPAFREALAAAGGFDIVINNAGNGYFGAAATFPEEELRRQFELLFFAHVELSQLAVEAMQTKGAGLIINVTSLAARFPLPFMGAYNAAKAAMASWTMTIQLELGDSPIRIVDLQPGDIRTEFNHSIRKGDLGVNRDRAARAWQVIDENMSKAPAPEIAAEAIVRLIETANPPPRIAVGEVFQTTLAPIACSFLPPRWRVWALRKYYGI